MIPKQCCHLQQEQWTHKASYGEGRRLDSTEPVVPSWEILLKTTRHFLKVIVTTVCLYENWISKWLSVVPVAYNFNNLAGYDLFKASLKLEKCVKSVQRTI